MGWGQFKNWMSEVGDGAKDLLDDVTGLSSAKEANTTNINQAALNRKFQETQATTAWNRQMSASNTAHQREMADLRAAGLNPILAAGGGGSSSPSASAPSGAQANVNPVDGSQLALAKATSALGLKTAKTGIDVQKQTEKLLKEKTHESWAKGISNEEDSVLKRWQTEQMRESTKLTAANAKGVQFDNAKKEAQMHQILNSANIQDSGYGVLLNFIRETSSALQGTPSAVNTGVKLLKKGKK